MAKLIDSSDEDPFDFNEDVERSWRAYMNAFQTDVFPMFKQYGLSLTDSLIIWELNRMKNAINRLAEKEDGS